MIELAQKSIVGKAKERPDLVKLVIDKVRSEGLVNTFRKVMGQLDSPSPLGYSCAGVVVDVGTSVDDFKSGDRVACAGAGYANHAEVVFVPNNLCVSVPEKVNLNEAAFVTLGAIALQGVRQATLTLGELVAVIGLGLLGQLTVQLVKAAGCQVLGIDLNANRVKLAGELGADVSILRSNDVNGAVASFTQGRGVDAVIIAAATDSNDPVELAGEISRDKGRVVAVGAVKMDVPRRTYYEKELDLRLSRSYGPGRYDAVYEEEGVDYPFGYVRWTEKRNMRAFLELIAEGKVNVKPLITHRFPFERALEAYDLILGKTNVGSGVKPPNNATAKTQETYLAVLLQYDTEKDLGGSIVLLKQATKSETRKWENEKKDALESETRNQRVSLGVIGAGNFAKGVLLPNLKQIAGAQIRAIATATGLSATHVGKKFDAEYVTSNYFDNVTFPRRTQDSIVAEVARLRDSPT
jgi:threonine dehydrogenase-like Zn-dependent dehydrogenase